MGSIFLTDDGCKVKIELVRIISNTIFLQCDYLKARQELSQLLDKINACKLSNSKKEDDFKQNIKLLVETIYHLSIYFSNLTITEKGE